MRKSFFGEKPQALPPFHIILTPTFFCNGWICPWKQLQKEIHAKVISIQLVISRSPLLSSPEAHRVNQHPTLKIENDTIPNCLYWKLRLPMINRFASWLLQLNLDGGENWKQNGYILKKRHNLFWKITILKRSQYFPSKPYCLNSFQEFNLGDQRVFRHPAPKESFQSTAFGSPPRNLSQELRHQSSHNLTQDSKQQQRLGNETALPPARFQFSNLNKRNISCIPLKCIQYWCSW